MYLLKAQFFYCMDVLLIWTSMDSIAIHIATSILMAEWLKF